MSAPDSIIRFGLPLVYDNQILRFWQSLISAAETAKGPRLLQKRQGPVINRPCGSTPAQATAPRAGTSHFSPSSRFVSHCFYSMLYYSTISDFVKGRFLQKIRLLHRKLFRFHCCPPAALPLGVSPPAALPPVATPPGVSLPAALPPAALLPAAFPPAATTPAAFLPVATLPAAAPLLAAPPAGWMDHE